MHPLEQTHTLDEFKSERDLGLGMNDCKNAHDIGMAEGTNDAALTVDSLDLAYLKRFFWNLE